jgi:hypothetical protein
MHTDANRLNELSGAIIGCAFAVLNAPGAGFREKVYENALAHNSENTIRSTSSPMRQLSQGNRPAALSAPQLRQATPGD